MFKCKPISEWSLTEVQETIDEHQRDYQAKRSGANMANAHVIQVATDVTSSSTPEPEAACAQMNTAKCA